MSAGAAVLLVGSARPRGASNSEMLGSYLLKRLESGGMTTTMLHVHHVREARTASVLLPALDAADLFILASPVYVDSLPHLVTRCMEEIAAHRNVASAQVDAPGTRTRFVAILNCGFPESIHTEVPLAICRCFARGAGLAWAGGLGLGGGEALGARPLESLGAMTRNVRRSLDLAAAALLAGRDVPNAAAELMARPLVPTPIYTFLGDLGWLRRARRNGVLRRLRARPYAPASSPSRYNQDPM